MGDRSEQSDEAEDRQPPSELTGYSFAVAKSVYCCWEWDLTERNIEFLGSVDTGYYQYLAERLHVDLNGDDAMRASIALRGAYHQGVETLVSLLGAYVQAPEAVPAWLARASTNDLKDVVRCFLDGDSLIAQSGERMVDLGLLADHVHAHAWGDSNGRTATVDRFERFWTRASEDFLSPSFRAEYNSMKHGMRIAPGGFSLSAGVEPSPGLAPQSMKVLGGGRYGSRFFQSQKVGQTNHHMRIQRTSLNWSAVAMAQRLALVSMSISNIISALRIGHGLDPVEADFRRPISPGLFEDAFREDVGVRSIRLDSVVQIQPVDEVSGPELLEELRSRSSSSSEDASG